MSWSQAKLTRNLNRIIPFGVIWLTTSTIFLLNDVTLTRHQNLNPSTDITLTPAVLAFALSTITLVGLLVGTIEMVILERKFRHYSLTRKVIYKFTFYMVLMLTIIAIVYPIAAIIESGVSVTDAALWEKELRFFGSLTFVNTMVQLSFSLFVSLLYGAIAENLGHNTLINLIAGRYHKPVVERRIFMFLDMKDSTTIAEQLGHDRYFDLLQDYYDLMSEPIIDSWGEVYQYIGDEVVVSWEVEKGAKDNRCINGFFAIKDKLKAAATRFQEKYGLLPDFKAGMHLGEVTIGEIGALKKEIVFTGDVLNTTSRIQTLCKEYAADLIISEDLLQVLDTSSELSTEALGALTLKGKKSEISLYKVTL